MYPGCSFSVLTFSKRWPETWRLNDRESNLDFLWCVPRIIYFVLDGYKIIPFCTLQMSGWRNSCRDNKSLVLVCNVPPSVKDLIHNVRRIMEYQWCKIKIARDPRYIFVVLLLWCLKYQGIWSPSAHVEFYLADMI